jgi:hypothetical protein
VVGGDEVDETMAFGENGIRHLILMSQAGDFDRKSFILVINIWVGVHRTVLHTPPPILFQNHETKQQFNQNQTKKHLKDVGRHPEMPGQGLRRLGN